MGWYLVISIAAIFGLLVLLDSERWKRKRLETVVAKLRNRETLNEEEVVLYMESKRFSPFGKPLSK